MLKQLFGHQNKGKTKQSFETFFFSPRNEDPKFLNLTFFSGSFIIALQLRF